MDLQKRGGSFSVIVPAYRCAPLLQESVQSVLQQTDENFEVIIIDDCSGDDTWQCIEELALRDQRIRPYRNEKNLGTARTRNRGIGLAKGAYLAFLDGDDRWLPDKLARQRRCLEETGCDVCYTGYSFIDAEGQPVRRPYRVPETFTREDFLRENFVGCSTAAFRADCLGPVRMRGEYVHEDYVFWLELLQNGAVFHGISQPLVEYRLLPGSRSADKLRSSWGRWRILRDYLKLPLPRAAACQAHYVVRGLRKHYF